MTNSLSSISSLTKAFHTLSLRKSQMYTTTTSFEDCVAAMLGEYKKSLFNDSIHSEEESIEKLRDTPDGTYVIWKEEDQDDLDFLSISVNQVSNSSHPQGVYHYQFHIDDKGVYHWNQTYWDPIGGECTLTGNLHHSSIQDLLSNSSIPITLPLSLFSELEDKGWIIRDRPQQVGKIYKEIGTATIQSPYENETIFCLMRSEKPNNILLITAKSFAVQKIEMDLIIHPGFFTCESKRYTSEDLENDFNLSIPLLHIRKRKEEKEKSEVAKSTIKYMPSPAIEFILYHEELNKRVDLYNRFTLLNYYKSGWIPHLSLFHKFKKPPEIVSDEFKLLEEASHLEMLDPSKPLERSSEGQILYSLKERYLSLDAFLGENLSLCRVHNFIPFDYNRTGKSEPFYFCGSDVEIDGIRMCLTQEPIEHTKIHFWTTVLNQEISAIFALSMPYESALRPYASPEHSFCYWRFDDVIKLPDGWCIFNCGKEELYAHQGTRIIRRLFTFRKNLQGDDYLEKEVHHYHFENWRDGDVPNERTFERLLEYAEQERKKHPQKPLMIHCRAGLGRTGTFAMAYYYREMLEKKIQSILSKDEQVALKEVAQLRLNFGKTLLEFRKQKKGLILGYRQYFAVMSIVMRYIRKSPLMKCLRKLAPDLEKQSKLK